MLLVAATIVIWSHGNSRVALLAMRGGPNLLDYGYDPDINARGDEAPVALDIESMLRTVRDNGDRERLATAYGLLQTNQFAKAMQAFEKVGNDFPNAYYGTVGQGMAAYGDGNYEIAAQRFQSALQVLAKQEGRTDSDPLSISARINLAIALTQLKQVDKARVEWQRIEINNLPKEERDTINRWKSQAENTP
jgi:TolA-binding protein